MLNNNIFATTTWSIQKSVFSIQMLINDPHEQLCKVLAIGNVNGDCNYNSTNIEYNNLRKKNRNLFIVGFSNYYIIKSIWKNSITYTK